MMDRLRAFMSAVQRVAREEWKRSTGVRGDAAIGGAIVLCVWGGLGLTSGPLAAQRYQQPPDPDPYAYNPIKNQRLEDTVESLTEKVNVLIHKFDDQQAQMTALSKEVHESQGSTRKSDYGLLLLIAGHLGVYGWKTKKGKESE